VTASAFTQITITAPQAGQSSAPATQVVEGDAANPLDVLIFNTSTTYPVYLSQDNYTTSVDAGTSRVTPLGPQESVVFTGELNVYAVALPGTTVVLNLYPSATNYTPFNGVTNLFAFGFNSNPAIPVFNLAAGQNLAVTVGTNLTLDNGPYAGAEVLDVSQYTAYDLTTFMYDVTDTVNTIDIKLIWYDDLVSGLAVYQEDWWIWVASSANNLADGNPMVGTGPMHGKYLLTVINNSLGAAPVTVSWVVLFGSNRTVAKSDWRQTPGLTFSVNGANNNPPAGSHWVNSTMGDVTAAYDDVLADFVFENLAANMNYFFPLPLYNGNIYYAIEVAASNTVSFIRISSASNNLQGAVPLGWSQDRDLQQIGTPTTDNLYTGELQLPRAACYLHVATIAAASVSAQIIALQ
jgi:hypothetical protein